tara:strand:- start:557 stop:1864 length:1308 start_codon:yes stop_codon:yes gene_type:complete
MTFRTIVLIWFLLVNCNPNWCSAYIFVEDTGSIGSLKGLLKENLLSNDIEILGYTPKSLNVVLNKTNKLQTSVAWLLREGFESEALIVSRCGHFEHNQYIEDLVRTLIEKKSKMPRLYIGWIPYKQLGQVTSQCILLDVPQTFDLASLALELAGLFGSQTEFIDKEIAKTSVPSSSIATVSVENEIQESKKIPMKWGQFPKINPKDNRESLSVSVQKLAYDPDEDLFLNPFVNTSSDPITENITESLQITVDENLSKKIDIVTTETASLSNETVDPKSLNILVKTPGNMQNLIESNPNSKPKVLQLSGFQATLIETSANKILTRSETVTKIMTSAIQKTEIQTMFDQDSQSNLASLKALYLTTSIKLPLKSKILQPVKNISKTVNNRQYQPIPSEQSDVDKKNLIKELKSDFRKELLDQFRKDRGRQTPEWLFEE